MSYNENLRVFIEKDKFIPIEFDLPLIIKDFPEYKKLNTEESISLIFNLVSTNKVLTDYIYGQIKFLLMNIPLDELFSLENIINGFRTSEDKKLENIIKSVIINKKNEKILNM